MGRTPIFKFRGTVEYLFQERLRNFCRDRGGMIEAARELGVSRASLYRWTNCQGIPGRLAMGRILGKLGEFEARNSSPKFGDPEKPGGNRGE